MSQKRKGSAGGGAKSAAAPGPAKSAAGGADNKDFTAAYKEDVQGAEARSDTKVIDIIDEEFPTKVMDCLDKKCLLVVEFYGPKCPACRSMIEFYNLLSVNHPNQVFCRINVRENEQIAYAARIEFLPTFIYYKDGQECDREVGTDAKTIEAKVNKHKQMAQPGQPGFGK